MNGPEKSGKQQSPEELVELLDRLMSGGSGHVNVFAEEDGTGVKVDTVKSTDICGTKGPCCQPTEEAVDDDDEL